MTAMDDREPLVTARLLTPRQAVGFVFFAFGATLGLWGGSVAEVLRSASISPDILGSALLGFSVAGILGMAIAGRIGKGVSLRSRLLILLAATAVCLAALFHATTATALVAGLFVYSFLAASVDLVMNSEGLAVESDRAIPVLAGFHGLASLGLAGGSIAGSLLSVLYGTTVTAMLASAIFALAIAAVLVGTPHRGATEPAGSGSGWFLPGAAVIAMGLIVGTSIAGEVASVMFSAQTLAAQAPDLAAYAGTGATAFALFQGFVRLGADRIRARMGDQRIIALSLATATVGFATVSASQSFAQTAFGFAIIGIGTACIVPCGFAVASRSGGITAAAAISMLALIGAVIRIPAPYAYGLIAEASDFSRAFLLYTALTAAALALALVSVVRTRSRRIA